VATAFLGQPHPLLRSDLLACYANGLTGTVAATNDPSPLRLFLYRGQRISGAQQVLCQAFPCSIKQGNFVLVYFSPITSHFSPITAITYYPHRSSQAGA
jgi:hypothetical protein